MSQTSDYKRYFYLYSLEKSISITKTDNCDHQPTKQQLVQFFPASAEGIDF